MNPFEAAAGVFDPARGTPERAELHRRLWHEAVKTYQDAEGAALMLLAGMDAIAAERNELRELLRRIAETTVVSGYGAFVPEGSAAIDVRAFAARGVPGLTPSTAAPDQCATCIEAGVLTRWIGAAAIAVHDRVKGHEYRARGGAA